MSEKVYIKLAKHLDSLPAGFPASENGVEIRILQHLFTPEEAELTLHLTLIAEDPALIAMRAGEPLNDILFLLRKMDDKGLIFSVLQKDGALYYRIQQFVIGFWEGQVNKLFPELIHDFEEYLDTFIDLDLWQKIPQLRTIPVEESISPKTGVLPYERAEELIRGHKTIAVNNCICRQEMHMIGKGCDRPVESCLSFGYAAERGIRQNRGRKISQEEALEILRQAEKDAHVLQTGNARKILFLCTCCGCCCAALRLIKLDPNPASRISSPFVACLNENTCTGCGICTDRCQMDAIRIEDGKAILQTNRCIGCGLCISTCPTNSFSLERKPKAKQPYVPKTMTETYIRLGHVSGRMKIGSMLKMQVKSSIDRLRI